jgi:hypothetical protein
MQPYVLDANVFINSHQCHYGMDFCPAFWDWLAVKNKSGIIFSIDRIRSELEECDDTLCAWAKEQGNGLFLPFDQTAADHLPRVIGWVEQQTRFKRSAIDAFSAGADMYLIAYALAHSHVVVTQEVSAPNSKTAIKIPDVCDGLEVQCVSLWELLRAEGAKFVTAS